MPWLCTLTAVVDGETLPLHDTETLAARMRADPHVVAHGAELPHSDGDIDDDWIFIRTFIAQGAINIESGLTTIEPQSRVHRAMLSFCRLVSEGHVVLREPRK